MASAYTPGLTVSGDITVRRVRRLPIKGEVLVKAGDQVTPEQVIARALLPGPLQTLKLAEKLGVEPKDVMALIHRRDVFRAHEESIDQVRNSRVEMKLWYAVKELHGNGQLEGVTLENTQTKEVEPFECDALIVNIGFKSSLGPLKEWGFEIVKNQILVNSRYETNLPGVFAVGDVCSFDEKLKLIATGVGEAATAVCFAKTYLDPSAKLFPGHSSDMDL